MWLVLWPCFSPLADPLAEGLSLTGGDDNNKILAQATLLSSNVSTDIDLDDKIDEHSEKEMLKMMGRMVSKEIAELNRLPYELSASTVPRRSGKM